MTKLSTTASLPGHLKVRLSYTTKIPVSEAALTMKDTLSVPGPYHEDVWVLLPNNSVYTSMEAFQRPFQALKDAHIVPEDAKLIGFGVTSPLLELNVLAYVIPEATLEPRSA